MKGATELAVLASLTAQERYGLEILHAINACVGDIISVGTLYPLLNRLERDGKVTSHWVEEVRVGHPRKYYRLTEDGTELLARMREEWKVFSTGITRVLQGGASS